MISFNALFFCRKGSVAFRRRITASLLMLFAFLIVIASLVICAAAGAAEVNYTGDGSQLLDSPSWLPRGSHPSVLPEADGAFLSSNNDVTVNYDADAAGTTNPYYVIGGLSQFENATGNTITFTNGKVEGYIYGGYSSNGNAELNTVTVLGGEVDQSVYGGYSNDEGNAENNSVVMSDGKVGMDVAGGYSHKGDANYNTVAISGGEVGFNVFGGASDIMGDGGNAEYNTVLISGGSVNEDVYGGLSTLGSASNNTVTIIGGYLDLDVYGGFSSKGHLGGSAANNTVTVSGGVVNGGIVGGYLDTGVVEHNAVTVSGGKVGEVYGGFSWQIANIVNNTVTISGGSVSGDVVGGYVDSNADVANNTVTISGGSVGGNVYGGYVNGDGDAIHNSVTIDGSPVFSASTYLYGGYTAGTGNNFTGNTLNVKSAGISAAGVGNFEYYNFYLSTGAKANETMLSVTDSVDLADAKAEIYLQGKTSLQAGDTVSLINSISGVSNYTAGSSQISQGAFLIYDFDIYAGTNDLWAKLTSVNASSSSKVLTNSRTAPLAFLNQGADLAASLERLEVSGDSRFTTFAVMGGGSSTYDTGSDVDIDSFSMLAGVTWNAPVKKNSLALSAFIEAGWSSYDTTNNFSGSKDVKGDGDSDYYGGGLHMRYEWDNDNPGGLYAEGSLRYGRVTTSFNSNDLQSGKGFHYDSGNNYYGVHAGLGYVWQLSGKTRLDVSGKYLWTHLESDELTASSGDRISFDSANSHRMRAGFRLYHDYGNANAVTLYYGAAYEYEFDGDADGRLYGTYALDGSSLSGGSGVGELGVMFRPSKDNDRLMMQLGIQGYVGVREGVSGTLKLQYAF